MSVEGAARDECGESVSEVGRAGEVVGLEKRVEVGEEQVVEKEKRLMSAEMESGEVKSEEWKKW